MFALFKVKLNMSLILKNEEKFVLNLKFFTFTQWRDKGWR